MVFFLDLNLKKPFKRNTIKLLFKVCTSMLCLFITYLLTDTTIQLEGIEVLSPPISNTLIVGSAGITININHTHNLVMCIGIAGSSILYLCHYKGVTFMGSLSGILNFLIQKIDGSSDIQQIEALTSRLTANELDLN